MLKKPANLFLMFMLIFYTFILVSTVEGSGASADYITNHQQRDYRDFLNDEMNQESAFMDPFLYAPVIIIILVIVALMRPKIFGAKKI